MDPMRILAEAPQTQVTEFAWLNPYSPWFFFLVLLPMVVAFAAFYYRRERISLPRRVARVSQDLTPEEQAAAEARESKRTNRVRRTLTVLRSLVLVLLLLIFAQPVVRTTTYENVDSSILVLVDDSLSMEIKDKYADRELVGDLGSFFRSTPDRMEDTTRYDLVRRLFRDQDIGFLDRLRDKGRLVVYGFSGGLRRLREIEKFHEGDAPMDPNSPEILPAQETTRAESRVQQTRISDCILDAVASERSSPLGGSAGRVAAVLLFSDGQQTPGARPLDEVARKLGQRSIPIYSVGVGNPDEPKDIRVTNLEVNEIVLVGDQVPFDVTVISEGFEGERLRVELKLDGAPVASEFVLLQGQGRRQPVRLVHRPRESGDFMATVEIERMPGELFQENNVVSKPIKVLDQKIRVLYAEGPPRWEYRYLKNALIRDPTMESQVFLFSADPDFVQESSRDVPPLVRFPASREELFSYHVIVLGDIDVAAELSSEQLSLLKEFVYDGGGGIVFIAGQNANPARYLHTDVYTLVPVEIPESGVLPGGASSQPVTTSFNVELTPVGREHEVMRLSNDPDRNTLLWENPDGREMDHLPGFYWYAQVGREKKGAVVLARHPTALHPLDQKGRVIFAFMNYGKGRTFFAGVDNTWRWRAGVDNQYLYRFWGQVIRFCATGRLLGKTPRFGISTDKSQYSLGATVSVDARVFDANLKPSTDKKITAYHLVRGVEGEGPEAIELDLDPVQGQGSFRGGLVASRVGLHDIWLGTETERLAYKTFEVAVPALERRDPRRNDAVLKEAAHLSGGEFCELYEVLKTVEAIEGESRSQQGDIETDPLWDEWWVLLAFTGIIALEWILRKWVHLL